MRKMEAIPWEAVMVLVGLLVVLAAVAGGLVGSLVFPSRQTGIIPPGMREQLAADRAELDRHSTRP